MPKSFAEYSKKWRTNNAEQDKQIHITYYNNNKKKEYARVARFRLFKKESKRLMNILLD